MYWKNLNLVLMLFVAYQTLAQNDEIELEGTYQGQNILVQNPFNSESEQYCVQEVAVNGLSWEKHQASSLEIDLSNYYIGQYVNIKMHHLVYCKPLFLNPTALRSDPSYNLEKFNVSTTYLIWETNNEKNEEPYYVEQYRNNKWVTVGKVIGKGSPKFNSYAYKVNHLTNLNKYRLKQLNKRNHFEHSIPVEYTFTREAITLFPRKVESVLHFSDEAEFEIFDPRGHLMVKGTGNQIDLSDWDQGIYYVNLDNRTEKIIKK